MKYTYLPVRNVPEGFNCSVCPLISNIDSFFSTLYQISMIINMQYTINTICFTNTVFVANSFFIKNNLSPATKI